MERRLGLHIILSCLCNEHDIKAILAEKGKKPAIAELVNNSQQYTYIQYTFNNKNQQIA